MAHTNVLAALPPSLLIPLLVSLLLRCPSLAAHPECWFRSDQSDYAGSVSSTSRGFVCDPWTDQDGVGTHNYCRNPTKSPKAWCRSRGDFDWCDLQLPIECTGSKGCVDSCATAKNGRCEDGGLGSKDSSCVLGSDCSDCGERGSRNYHWCQNSCGAANYDGVCDDGGSNSKSAICPFGTDCADCGNRTDSEIVLCSNECEFKEDGVCDDGVDGQQGGVCNPLCRFGSDCTDCGDRSEAQRGEFMAAAADCSTTLNKDYYSPLDFSELAEGEWQSDVASDMYYGDSPNLEGYYSDDLGMLAVQQVCSNDCTYAADGQCDDGGPSSLTAVCVLGTDCSDCGNREEVAASKAAFSSRLEARKEAANTQDGGFRDQSFINSMALLVMVAILLVGLIFSAVVMRKAYIYDGYTATPEEVQSLAASDDEDDAA